MENEYVDYDKLKEALYSRLDKIGWEYAVTGSGIDEDIDIITGINKGVSYSINFKPDKPVYLLYKNRFRKDGWGNEDLHTDFIGEYQIIGRIFAKIRALDEEMKERDLDD